MTAGQGPAPSGARRLGDKYQDLLTWLHAAKLLHRDPEVVRVELEKHGAGNLDDLVVHRADGPGEYHQVKFARNPAHRPLHADWFTDKGVSKRSPLQRFHQSWKDLTVEDQRPFMILHTNRLPADGDKVLECIDGITERLVPKFAYCSPESEVGKTRAAWAEHLEVDEAELLAMLSDLRIRAARASIEELREHCRWVMDSCGLLNTSAAVDQGMVVAGEWIETGVREIDAAIVSGVVTERALRATDPRATMLIQAIDHDVYPELATEQVDWVAEFIGDTPRARREPKITEIWHSRFAPELAAAEHSIAAQGYREIRLAGDFRLATSIFAGATFSDTRGYQLLITGRSGDKTWTGDFASYGPTTEVGMTCDHVEVGRGSELAIAIAITGDPSSAVLKHIEAVDLPIGQLALLSLPAVGPGALADDHAVRGWVIEVREELRELSEQEHDRWHLFFYGPQTAAVLLGHSWNRMPSTQLWDDLGPGRGYTAAFVIAG
jgi:hypothetical protein